MKNRHSLLLSLVLFGFASASPAELLTNRQFGMGDLTGWATFGQGWRIGVEDDSYVDDYGVVNDVLSTDVDMFRGVYQEVPVTAGESYSASVFIRTVNIAASVSWLEVQWLDSEGGILLISVSDWITGSQPFTIVQMPALIAPAGAVSASVRGVVQMPDSAPLEADFHVFDSFSFIQNPVSVLANRSFESGDLSGWATFGEGWRLGSGNDAASGLFGVVNDVLPASVDEWRGIYQQVPVEAGEVYAAAASIRAVNLSTSESWLEVQWLDEFDGVIGQVVSDSITESQPYTRIALPYLLAPPDAVAASVRGVVRMLEIPADGNFHLFDDFVFIQLPVMKIGIDYSSVPVVSWSTNYWRDGIEYRAMQAESDWAPISWEPHQVDDRWIAVNPVTESTIMYRYRHP